MNYHSINWDDAWAAMLEPFHAASNDFHANMGDMPDRKFKKIETRLNREDAKYDKFCLESAACELYAERLINNLTEKYPKYQFAAHTDPYAHPPNGYWRILGRAASGKSIASKDYSKLKRAAKAILRNVEKKYPGEGEKAQAKAAKVYEKNRPTAKGKSGCLLVFLLCVVSLSTALAFAF